MAQINVSELFKQIRLKLKLQWVAGLDGGNKVLTSGTVTKPSLALVGHLNFVHPNRVQVLGCAEMDYLRNLSIIAMQQSDCQFIFYGFAAIVVANGEKHHRNCLTPPTKATRPYLLRPCKAHN
jgi:HPr kinase/phosphorylase